MLKRNQKIKTCLDLLQNRIQPSSLGKKITFSGVGQKDVYNITAPFQDGDEIIIAGRVEQRNSEFSKIIFFTEEKEDVWVPLQNHPEPFNLQDPFITKINGELIFGGVEVITNSNNPKKIESWVTQFYRGSNVHTLKHFFTGPVFMKDIRFIQLADDSIGVLTRPQGERGGRGKIGFTTFKDLDSITTKAIEEAHIFEDQFVAEDWGGANEVHLLKNNLIGVLGHIARFDKENKKYYYSITFAMDPDTYKKTEMKIIATRDDFPDGPSKRPDLKDVLFSGGIVRSDNEQAELYTGVSDAEAHRITIPDPFLAYEKL